MGRLPLLSIASLFGTHANIPESVKGICKPEAQTGSSLPGLNFQMFGNDDSDGVRLISDDVKAFMLYVFLNGKWR